MLFWARQKMVVIILFIDIDWGTEVVFKQTQKKAEQLNLSIAYLPILNDVDRPEDLEISYSN
jgi:uncharacterized protein